MIVVNVASTLALTHEARRRAAETSDAVQAQALTDAADSVMSGLALVLNQRTAGLPPELAPHIELLRGMR